MFFVRQFRGVGQSGINVFDAKGRIARQDLILGGTLGKAVVDPARRKALAWGYADHGHDAHRDSGKARRQGR